VPTGVAGCGGEKRRRRRLAAAREKRGAVEAGAARCRRGRVRNGTHRGGRVTRMARSGARGVRATGVRGLALRPRLPARPPPSPATPASCAPKPRDTGLLRPQAARHRYRLRPCHHARSTPTAQPLWPRSGRPSTRGKNRRRRRCEKPPGTCCRCWKETPPAVRWKCGWYRSRRCSASPDRGTREGLRPTSLRPIRLPGSSLPPGVSAGRRPWNPGRSQRVVRELICPGTFR